jgi:histone H3/H4|tara:strand:+ start:851 stop:1033 length:183 start_codon:yes stop_codon:yes gene_type:complete
MGTALVVRSQIKNFAKTDGKTLNISNEFYNALNKKVEKTIEEACIRAIANNRTTLMGRDV